MPVYEYECESCSYRFEMKQGFDDNPVATCPRCECNARRIFSPTPIIFKGSGFYVTDNAAQDKKRASHRQDGDKPAEIKPADIKPSGIDKGDGVPQKQ